MLEEPVSTKCQRSWLCVFCDDNVSHLVELCIEGIKIEKKVDSGIRKCSHASIMVSHRIDVINPYGIGSQIRHQPRVEAALGAVGERVQVRELVCNAWAHASQYCTVSCPRRHLTFDVILGAIGEEELGAHCRNGGHGDGRYKIGSR